MAGIFQRSLRLRTALRHLSPQSPLSWTVTGRHTPLDLHCPFLPSTSWQFAVCSRKLHTGGDRPSPAAAPDRLPFSRITQEDLAFFRKILPGRAVTDPDLLESSNVDWLKSVKGESEFTSFHLKIYFLVVIIFNSSVLTSSAGSSELLLRPQTTEEVSQILK